MSDQSFLQEVKNQYEQFPYPPRNPSDETGRLIQTWLDYLPLINHFGFSGKQPFSDDFRCLIAGGGTGDATIFLAEQLKATKATIVHLDMSQASLNIARERAATRGLSNIEFVQESILNLPALGLAPFDYINCCGVLHHLEDPNAGLESLLSVLKLEGIIGLMLYGKIGRTGVYQMQEMLQQVTGDAMSAEEKVAATKDILAQLPTTNWYQHSKTWISDIEEFGDSGIYDLFLHSQDRAYSVSELYEWLVDEHKLHISLNSEFRGHLPYDPEVFLPPSQHALLKAKTLRERESIAELLSGSLIKHCLFVTRDAGVANIEDADLVPFFAFCMAALNIPQMANQIEQNPGQALTLNLYQNSNRPGLSFNYLPGKLAHHLFRAMDGNTTIGEIVASVSAQPEVKAAGLSESDVASELSELIGFFEPFAGVLLRHKDTAAYQYLD